MLLGARALERMIAERPQAAEILFACAGAQLIDPPNVGACYVRAPCALPRFRVFVAAADSGGAKSDVHDAWSVAFAPRLSTPLG